MCNKYIKIIEFEGKAGGFTQSTQKMYSVFIVNECESKELLIDSESCNGRGYSYKESAVRRAESFAELLDLEIRYFTRERKVIFEDVEN